MLRKDRFNRSCKTTTIISATNRNMLLKQQYLLTKVSFSEYLLCVLVYMDISPSKPITPMGEIGNAYRWPG